MVFCRALRYASPKFHLFSASSSSSSLSSPSSYSTMPQKIDFQEAYRTFRCLLDRHPPAPMIQVEESIRSIATMRHCYNLNNLIHRYCHVGPINLAFSAFGQILKHGFQPDTSTLTTLMKGLVINDKDDVEKAICKAHDFGCDLRAKGFKLDDKAVYDTVVDALCPNRRAVDELIQNVMTDVLDTFNDWIHEPVPPSSIEINPLFSFVAMMGQHETVISFVTQAVSKGFTPDSDTLSILIDSCFHASQMTFAFSALGKILKLGSPPDTDTLTTLLKGLWLHNILFLLRHDTYLPHVDQGFTLFQQIVDRGISPGTVACNMLIYGLCKSGGLSNFNGARQIFEYLLVNGHDQDCDAVIQGLCRLGLFEEAKALLYKIEEMNEKGCLPVTLEALLLLLESGFNDEARIWLTKSCPDYQNLFGF